MTNVATSGTAVVTLPSDTQVLVTRDFNAPRQMVYKAYTTPELVRRWWAGRRGQMTVAEIDLRVGGAWRFVMIASEGMEVGFHGTYREIVPDERLVHTEVYEAMPDAEVVNTITLAEADGRTTMTVLVDCGTQEIRDGMMASGMEVGMQEAYDLIEEIAIELAEQA
jgi:uncharacterized protein YndB with AHSA1/START domain